MASPVEPAPSVSANELPNPALAEPELSRPDTDVYVDAPKGRRAAATFVFLTVALDMLAMGIIAPVLPHLIAGFLAGDVAQKASGTAGMLGLFGTVFAAMQFFFSPVLGSLSDRFGRRPIIRLSNFGLGADYLMMAWAPALPWLLAGRIISGLTASSIPTAMAYMADVTPREQRAAAFGMLNAAFGFGFVVGPALGGLLGNHNPRLPFWVAGGLSLVNALYGYFVLPESLPDSLRSKFSWKRANPIGSVALLRRSGSLIALSGLLLLGYTAQQSLMNIYVLSAEYRFGWSDRTVGLSLAFVGLFTILYGVLLVKPAVTKLGERGAIFFGLAGGAAGYAMLGASRTGLLLWCGIPFLNLMSVTWPAAQSIMSKATGPSEQGQLQGAINSLRGISGLIGPGLFTIVFAHAVRVGMPGSPFYVASGLLLLAMLLATRATRMEGRKAPAVHEIDCCKTYAQEIRGDRTTPRLPDFASHTHATARTLDH